MIISPEKVETIMRDVAARIILPRFRALDKSDIFTKSSETDLVTIADREAEEELDKALTALEPGSVVIGEEGISAGRTSTEMLKEQPGTVWVVDPIDGTWNFVHGKEEFAVMVARVVGGETVQGWIYDVPAGRMLYAERGGGAFIDTARLSVATPKPLAATTGFCAARYFPKEIRGHVKEFATRIKTLHVLGCAGHEYLQVASGRHDFAIYNRGRPWDHLAGTLAVQEAGGIVRKFDGSSYTPQDDYAGLICAANETLLKEVVAANPAIAA